MSFLAPLFLLGAAAIGLPLLFHLIRRTTRERTQFSSLQFLKPSPPRLTRRSRLEHILLLVLRCAVICLLALAFARPFLKGKPELTPPAGRSRVLVLLDTSASMQRGQLWQQAVDRADAVLRRLTPADQAAVFTFDRQIRPLVSFDEWSAAPAGQRHALALAKLRGTRPGWASTQLGTALMGAAAEVSAEGEGEGGVRKVILITDAQEGSRVQALQGHEWPRDLEVSVEPVRARTSNNASLHLATEAAGADSRPDHKLRVRVLNSAASKRNNSERAGRMIPGVCSVRLPKSTFLQGRAGWSPWACPPGPTLTGSSCKATTNLSITPHSSFLHALPNGPLRTCPTSAMQTVHSRCSFCAGPCRTRAAKL
jgi:hypothetical protein